MSPSRLPECRSRRSLLRRRRVRLPLGAHHPAIKAGREAARPSQRRRPRSTWLHRPWAGPSRGHRSGVESDLVAVRRCPAPGRTTLEVIIESAALPDDDAIVRRLPGVAEAAGADFMQDVDRLPPRRRGGHCPPAVVLTAATVDGRLGVKAIAAGSAPRRRPLARMVDAGATGAQVLGRPGHPRRPGRRVACPDNMTSENSCDRSAGAPGAQGPAPRPPRRRRSGRHRDRPGPGDRLPRRRPPTPTTLAAWFTDGAARGDLVLYLEGFDHTVGVMQTAEALERVAAGVRRGPGRRRRRLRRDPLRPRAAPRRRPQPRPGRRGRPRGVPPAAAGTARSPSARCSAPCGTAANSADIADLALRHRDAGVVGFDIAGSEVGLAPEPAPRRLPPHRRGQPPHHHPRRRGVRAPVDLGGAAALRRRAARPRRADRRRHRGRTRRQGRARPAGVVRAGPPGAARDVPDVQRQHRRRRRRSPSTRSACSKRLRFRVTVNTDNRLDVRRVDDLRAARHARDVRVDVGRLRVGHPRTP